MPEWKCFDLMNNFCEAFEIGRRVDQDVWLQGVIVQGEFVFNGRIFLKDGSSGAIIDNFPKADQHDGWVKQKRLDVDGYQLINADGDVIFSYFIENNVCRVDVDLYARDGSLAAHGGQGGLVVNVPFRMG